MHHARSKALVDKDGVHDTMNMPEDLGAPVFQELDPDWIGTPRLNPDCLCTKSLRHA